MKLVAKYVLFFAVVALAVFANRPEPFLNPTGCASYTGFNHTVCTHPIAIGTATFLVLLILAIPINIYVSRMLI
jgi:hypothetical protein